MAEVKAEAARVAALQAQLPTQGRGASVLRKPTRKSGPRGLMRCSRMCGRCPALRAIWMRLRWSRRWSRRARQSRLRSWLNETDWGGPLGPPLFLSFFSLRLRRTSYSCRASSLARYAHGAASWFMHQRCALRPTQPPRNIGSTANPTSYSYRASSLACLSHYTFQ
jgi:hypothetical protein